MIPTSDGHIKVVRSLEIKPVGTRHPETGLRHADRLFALTITEVGGATVMWTDTAEGFERIMSDLTRVLQGSSAGERVSEVRFGVLNDGQS